MNTIEAIKTKRAVRRFSVEEVPQEVIEQIVDAGRRAQSSKNTQPWQFVITRNRQTLAELASCGKGAGHLAGAAFAVAIVAGTTWAFDIGQAAAYLQLAAWDQGVSSCIAYMHDQDRARTALNVPADQTLEIVISFGYAAETPQLSLRPGGRRPLDEVLRWEQWSQ